MRRKIVMEETLGEKRHESISSPDAPTYLPLKVNYIGLLPSLFRANIKGLALWALKWLSLAALAISLVLGFLVVSDKNRCERLLRFFRGDTTMQYESPPPTVRTGM